MRKEKGRWIWVEDAFAIVLCSFVMVLLRLGNVERLFTVLEFSIPQVSGEICILVLNFAEIGHPKRCGTLKKLHTLLKLVICFWCNTFSSLQGCSCTAKVNHCEKVVEGGLFPLPVGWSNSVEVTMQKNDGSQFVGFSRKPRPLYISKRWLGCVRTIPAEHVNKPLIYLSSF